MRTLVFFFIVLFLAIVAGVLIKMDSGYVFIAYSNWTMEMPLWLGVAILLIGMMIIFLVQHFFHFIARWGMHFRHWRLSRRAKKSAQRTQQGWIAYFYHQFPRMEKQLLEGVKQNPLAFFNYLGAAVAAYYQKKSNAYEHYKKLALSIAPREKIAIELLQAELQLAHQQMKEAKQTLQKLYNMVPKHPRVLHLLKKLYLATKDDEALMLILPKLQPYLPKEEFKALEIDTYRRLLMLNKTQADASQKIWEQIPKKLRGNPELFYWYGRANPSLSTAKQIEKLLSLEWQDGLINLYSEIECASAAKQLAQAEKWLSRQPNNPILFLALARIAMRLKYWAKAKEYGEHSLHLSPALATYAFLGNLYEEMGDNQKAMACYKKATRTATG